MTLEFLEKKRKEIIQFRDEIEEKKKIIIDLEAPLREKEDEVNRLKAVIAEKDEEIKELERQLVEGRDKPPTPESVDEENDELPVEVTEDVDSILAQYINIAGWAVPIKRLGEGYYIFGTKKIFAKILNGQLVIRVGGGYIVIEEFINTYSEQELTKVNQRRLSGLDIFTGYPLGQDSSGAGGKSPGNKSSSDRSPKIQGSPKGGKSPGSNKHISGTDTPTRLTADNIKEYKEK